MLFPSYFRGFGKNCPVFRDAFRSVSQRLPFLWRLAKRIVEHSGTYGRPGDRPRRRRFVRGAWQMETPDGVVWMVDGEPEALAAGLTL